MFLKELSLLNFKNYQEANISFTKQINCFVGNNGEGKTNLLDAIYYLSFCKSFFNPIDSNHILDSAPFLVIQGTFVINDTTDEIYCGLKRNEKKQFKRNKKEYSRLSDHIGLYPLVMVSPVDINIINEGSDIRRKFIDSIVSQYNKEYLNNLIKYNKVLAHRNALLKKNAELHYFDFEILEIWDIQLIELASLIFKERKVFLEEFTVIFYKYYNFISSSKEDISLSYDSSLINEDFGLLLKKNYAKDHAAQYTTCGVHKDDLFFFIAEKSLKKFGSQGQQKSYLLALKLAQFDILKKNKNTTPILLLDDIYDRLDEIRIKQLLELVNGGNFGQVFITDTHSDRLAKILKSVKADYSVFIIENGKIQN